MSETCPAPPAPAAPARRRGRRRRRSAAPPRPAPGRRTGRRGCARRGRSPRRRRTRAGSGARGEQQGRRAPLAQVPADQLAQRPLAEAVAVDEQHQVGGGEEVAQRMERAQGAEDSGSSDQVSGMPAMGVAEALADLVAQVVEVDRRRLAAGGGELRQGVAEDAARRAPAAAAWAVRRSAAAAACPAPPRAPARGSAYPACAHRRRCGSLRGTPSRAGRPDAA